MNSLEVKKYVGNYSSFVHRRSAGNNNIRKYDDQQRYTNKCSSSWTTKPQEPSKNLKKLTEKEIRGTKKIQALIRQKIRVKRKIHAKIF
jgi:hypothetical protein